MPIEKFGWNKKSVIGFAWHQAIGAVCFFFDIGIIYLVLHFGHLYYPAAVAIGFIFATLLNYALARATIYSNSGQSHERAMLYFFSMASVMLLITVGGTVFLREEFHLHLYLARVLVGLLVSVIGYFTDCLVTFKLR